MGDVESEFVSDQTKESQDSCLKTPEISDTTICGGSLGPTTPDTDKENGDLPLAVPKKLPDVFIFASQTNTNPELLNDSSSPETPTDGVFDPFAPGPDDKLWAPQCKKYCDEVRPNVARRLIFDNSFKGFGCDDSMSLSDQKILESVYENLLEVIISNQTESVLTELANAEGHYGPCETPPGPKLNGVAETCPDAPLKLKGKLKGIDLGGLCRKLEF